MNAKEELIRRKACAALQICHLNSSTGRYLLKSIGKLSSRWGYMPANQTHEPSLMPAIAVPSWFLDIDTYQDFKEPIEFNPEDVRERTMQLATRSHGFFRWAVSDDFLRSYGGEL